ncbi:MAG TPA: ATPase domain-containing protein [Ktedonobacterales bacterium]|nr:ATPase domain-containing protein [Ktedonobacterales bacterium]
MSRKQRDERQEPSQRPQDSGSASSAAKQERQQFEPTGVLNLDAMLGGGLPRGALTLILGLPGSGKTTLASQIAFTSARAGKTVLILTALSEPTTKLIEHLASYRFFDRSLIGGPVQFLSMQQLLPQGLTSVAAAILAETRRAKVDYVLLDGFRGMRSVDSDSQAARQFLYDIGTTLNALGVTTLITSETDPRDPTFFPESTTADVILGLHYALHGVRQYRGIEVIKARGAAAMPGMHALTLDDEGATVYPQLEERVTAEPQATSPAATETQRADAQPEPTARAAFDMPEFDAMLRGGVPRGTCTVVAGSLGTGKTLLALNFALAGCRAGEHVVYLSFRESRAQLRQVGLSFALSADLTQALEVTGRFVFIEAPPIKINPDILADHLMSTLDQTGAQRVVIDSVAEVERAILRGLDPARLEDFLGALLQAMRRRGVTALLIKETDKVVAASLELSADALSVLAENVLLLQHIPYQGHLHRIISVPKLRFSDHDTAIREFRIRAPEGLEVLAPFESGQGVLEGVAWDQEQRASGRAREIIRRPPMPNAKDQP